MLDEDLVKFFKSLVKENDYGDIRLCEKEGDEISLENSQIKHTLKIKNAGFGLRIYKNGAWGFASSADLSKNAIRLAVDKAYKSIRQVPKTKNIIKFEQETTISNAMPSWKMDTREVSIERKLAVLKDMYAAAKLPKVASIQSEYEDEVKHWLIGNTLGTNVSFYESHPAAIISVFVKDALTTQAVKKSLGGSGGFELFNGGSSAEVGKAAAEEAIKLLGAKSITGGKYDVVLDSAMTGVYTHEALGHACEADAVLSGTSVLEHKLGKVVGPEIVTIIDDPTLPNIRGSFTFDQEGTKSEKHVLVENGILKEYMHTLETAAKSGKKSNGAARSTDSTVKPLVRMSNTFIQPGDFKADIFEDVKLGISFYGFQYGYADTGSGKFMFKAQYGRMIRNGKLAEYVRDAAIGGMTLDILHRIDAVGDSLALDGGICGKGMQWVPVTSGGPEIRIREVVVGGQ
jgi:TldD protein